MILQQQDRDAKLRALCAAEPTVTRGEKPADQNGISTLVESGIPVLRFNEGLACDAIVRHLEARAKAHRANLQLHDKHPKADRRIELTVEVGSTLYAVEHTGIEPFPEFMRMNGDSERLYDPLVRDASAALPDEGMVELHIPVGALLGKNQKELRAIQTALVEFVVSTAPTLPYRRYADRRNPAPVQPSGVPFAVSLHRLDLPNPPVKFTIMHVLDGNLETRRAARIQQACDDKFPKLAAWKASDCARTILILEDNDIQLTNETIVADAFLPIARQRVDRPDETYVLMTCAGSTWYAWPMLIDGVSYFDLSERYHPIHLEIDSRTLTSLTSR